MINPYSGINLSNTERILSVSHQHLSHAKASTQRSFDEIYATDVKHFCISRYRPSIITYPFDYTNNTFEYVANDFHSTDDVETLKIQDAVTINIQNDVIGSPNAEHIYPLLLWNGAWNKWSSIHINSVGSLWESCLIPDSETGYQNASSGLSYSDDIRGMIANLLYSDSGGVIVNHPEYTENSKHFDFDLTRFIEDCLDLDQRVLGTDVISSGTQTTIAYNSSVIDTILSTGRRCWMFCIGDWARDRGRNELLIPTGLSRAEKEHACLKAYRDGAFFGRWANSELKITSIGLTNGTFTMTADNADGINVVIDGEETEYQGTSVSVEVPNSAKYVRAYAYIEKDDDPDWGYKDGDIYKDVVYTNPIMVNPVIYPYNPAYDLTKTRNKFMTWMWG